MFIVVTVAVMAFSAGGERLSNGIAAALLWAGMFFIAVTGLGRSFIAEEERGTALLLRLSVPSTPVYAGKLLVNAVLALASNAVLSLLFLAMMGAEVGAPVAFAVVLTLASLGLAGALTVIAALIARAGAKGALYPVLAFPLILPLVVLGVDLLRRSIAGIGIGSMADDLLLLALYTVGVVLSGYLLFDLIWRE